MLGISAGAYFGVAEPPFRFALQKVAQPQRIDGSRRAYYSDNLANYQFI